MWAELVDSIVTTFSSMDLESFKEAIAGSIRWLASLAGLVVIVVIGAMASVLMPPKAKR